MNIPSNNHPNHGGHESVLTMADIQAAAEDCKTSTTDPLSAFPDLRNVALDACRTLAMLLMAHGASPALAQAAASSAYSLTTLATLSVHRAIWNTVLGDNGNPPE